MTGFNLLIGAAAALLDGPRECRMAEQTIIVAVDDAPFGSPVLPYAEAIARITDRPLRLIAVARHARRGHSVAAASVAEDRERVRPAPTLPGGDDCTDRRARC